MLGPVHGRIGPPQQCVQIGVAGFVYRDPDTDRDDNGMFAQHERLAHGANDFFGHLSGVAPDIIDVFQNDGELVARQARNEVAAPHRQTEPGTELLEQQVARVMAETVVDLLEAIQIEKHHGHHAPAAPGSVNRFAQPLHE